MTRYALLRCVAFCLLSVYGPAHAGALADHGDGTISDLGTQLMWQKRDDGAARTWEAALAYCEGLVLAGHADWRLPNIKELKSTADMTKTSPAINTTYFPGAQSACYWSSTSSAGNALKAWAVNFNAGSTGSYSKTASSYTRCVR